MFRWLKPYTWSEYRYNQNSVNLSIPVNFRPLTWACSTLPEGCRYYTSSSKWNSSPFAHFHPTLVSASTNSIHPPKSTSPEAPTPQPRLPAVDPLLSTCTDSAQTRAFIKSGEMLTNWVPTDLSSLPIFNLLTISTDFLTYWHPFLTLR